MTEYIIAIYFKLIFQYLPAKCEKDNENFSIKKTRQETSCKGMFTVINQGNRLS